MATRIARAPKILLTDAQAETTGITPRKALLACGLLYAVLYPIVSDAIAATLYDGYSRMSQAVSELSATGAPTHTFLTAVGPIFSMLLIGFGLGIWRSANGKRSLRIAGALVVAHGAMGFLWMFGPMSQREVIAAGGATSADTMHLVLSAATGLFVAAYVAITAFAFGWVFRLYSIVTIAAALVFGLLSAQVDKIEAGDPTPYMGLLERIGIGAWLLWMAVVAVILLRTRTVEAKKSQSEALSSPVWHNVERGSFAVISYTTPFGDPRSSGVMYKTVGERLFVVVAPDSWKARHIGLNGKVAVTVPVRRGGLLSLVFPIPPATISFHGTAIVHQGNSAQVSTVMKELEHLLPVERRTSASVIEIIPEGAFVTYGIGVSLNDMRDPDKARARVPVGTSA